MKKQTIKIATLTALVTCAFNLQSAAFDPNDPPQHLGSSLTSRMTRTYIKDLLSVEKYRSAFVSKEAFEHASLVLPHMSIKEMLPDIAQEYGLYCWKKLPKLLPKLLAKASEIRHNEPDISFEAIVEKLQHPFSQEKYAELMRDHEHFPISDVESFIRKLFKTPEQPAWLRSYFSGGFSVKDLNDNGLLQYNIGTYQNGHPNVNDYKVVVRNKIINDLIGIQDIPNAENITELYLLQKKITYVDAGAFRTFKHLTGLVLSANRIASLNPEAFVGLDKLTALDLSDNCLTAISVGIFSNLSCLRVLDLKYNSIPTSERARIQAEIPNVKIYW